MLKLVAPALAALALSPVAPAAAPPPRPARSPPPPPPRPPPSTASLTCREERSGLLSGRTAESGSRLSRAGTSPVCRLRAPSRDSTARSSIAPRHRKRARRPAVGDAERRRGALLAVRSGRGESSRDRRDHAGANDP